MTQIAPMQSGLSSGAVCPNAGKWGALLRPEQASCCTASILPLGTMPRLGGFRARIQTNIIMFAERRKKTRFLSLGDDISRFLEGQPWHFEELLAQIPVLYRICNNLIPHNNNPGYILPFYGMYAWLPFLSKGILYRRCEVMTM